MFDQSDALRHPIMTCVPLEDAASINVFTCPKTGTYKGIVLEYKNGAQRAIGLCRIGIDSVTTYHKPMNICCYKDWELAERPEFCQTTKLEITVQGNTHDHDQSHWTCSSLDGDIECMWDHWGAQMYLT
jgi:hypothetical protein